MIKFKLLNDDAKMPIHMGAAAGIDLHTTGIKEMREHTIDYGTGLAVEIPPGYVGLLCIRSSLGTNGHMLANNVGIIDPDYRNEIIIKLDRAKHANAERKIEPGDRIAQLVIVPFLNEAVAIVNELSKTNRTGGFGSTGR